MKRLEEAIKNQPNPVPAVFGYVFDGDQIEEYIKRIEVEFETFKKENVCIKRDLFGKFRKEHGRVHYCVFCKTFIELLKQGKPEVET